MPDSRGVRLDPATIRSRYNVERAYRPIDAWHRHTARQVGRLVSDWWAPLHLLPEKVVLNAGAGGNDFGIPRPAAVSLDLHERPLVGMSRPVVANVEALPLASCSVDAVLCVGSVINYADAVPAITELSRVLRPGGYLALEFESSRSAELFGTPAFGAAAAVTESFCGNTEEVVWAYRLDYILSLLQGSNIHVERVIPIHLLSPWLLLISKRPAIAAAFGRLDGLGRLPLLRRWASNFFLTCRKSFSR